MNGARAPRRNACLKEIPVRVCEPKDEKDRRIRQLVDEFQKEQVFTLERARAVKKLVEMFRGLRKIPLNYQPDLRRGGNPRKTRPSTRQPRLIGIMRKVAKGRGYEVDTSTTYDLLSMIEDPEFEKAIEETKAEPVKAVESYTGARMILPKRP